MIFSVSTSFFIFFLQKVKITWFNFTWPVGFLVTKPTFFICIYSYTHLSSFTTSHPCSYFFFYRLITRLKSISQRSYTFDADILYGKNKKFLPLQSLLPSHIEVSTENCCTFSFWWCVLRYIHANYFFHFQITFYQRNNTIFGLPNTSFDPYLYFVLYFPFNTFHTNTFNNSTWWFNFFIH